MRALYLIPGLVCLFLGGIFLLVYRSSRIKQETTNRDVTAQTWGRLVDTESKTEREVSTNMTLRMGSTSHPPLIIAIILCRMSPEQRETR